MRDYELVLIFDPEEEGEETKVLTKVKKWLGRKGKVVGRSNWGIKALAYPLVSRQKRKKLQKGRFIQVDFEAEPEVVAEIEKRLKLEEEVFRYLIVRKQPMRGGEKKSGKKPE